MISSPVIMPPLTQQSVFFRDFDSSETSAEVSVTAFLERSVAAQAQLGAAWQCSGDRDEPTHGEQTACLYR